MQDRIWRLPPCPPYDVEGMESWLSDMGRQGWKLEPDDFFLGIASFRKTDPAPVRYRLEASQKRVSAWDDDGGVPDREAWELNTDCGWEYAGRRGQFFIYRTSDEGVRELHTDPQVQALAIKAVEKRRLWNLLTLILYWIIYGLMRFWKGSSLLLFAAKGGLPIVLLVTLLVLWTLVALGAEVRYLGRLKRRLKAGSPPDHEKNWRKERWRWHGGRLAMLILLILYAALSFRLLGLTLNQEDRLALSDYTGKPPFATMADFAEGEYSITWKNKNYSYVSEWSNALVRRGVEWGEHAKIQRPDGTLLDGSLYITYYEAGSKALARLLAGETARAYRAREKFTPLELPDLGMDEVSAYRNEMYHPIVVLRLGNRVLKAQFYQYGENERIPLEVWTGILAASIALSPEEKGEKD